MKIKNSEIPRREKRLYKIWSMIKQRCYNPNSSKWRTYGGRGIGICPSWLDYAIFESWALSHGWQLGLAIDRKNNDGFYEPDNCQIITRSANSSKDHSKTYKILNWLL